VLAALLLAALAAAPIWIPDPPQARGTTLQGTAWAAEGKGWAARLTPLDDAERWAYLRDLGGAAADPFAPKPGTPPAFLTYLLTIDNLSAVPMGFQAANCRLITRNRRIGYPLDLPTLETTFHQLDREIPPAWATIRPALFDGETTIAPGGRASGLLVFRAPEPRTRSFTVEVLLSTASVEEAAFMAAYRRAKEGQTP